jgi:hypothetical protein
MVNKLLKTMSASSGLHYIDYEAFFVHRDHPRAGDFHDSFIPSAFRPEGFCYGPFRAYCPIPNPDRYRCLVILRDPRDVLTSHYYSVAFSHTVITKALSEARKRALAMTIDDHVLHYLPVIKQRYQEYVEHLLGREHVLYLKYEDMITDFPGWLRQLMDSCGFQADSQTMDSLILEMAGTPSTEDKYSHRRQGHPGDYMRKLKPDTIATLNKELSGILYACRYGKD